MRFLAVLTLLTALVALAHAWPPRYTWRRGHINQVVLNPHPHVHVRGAASAAVTTTTAATPTPAPRAMAKEKVTGWMGKMDGPLRSEREVQREMAERREAMARKVRRWRGEV